MMVAVKRMRKWSDSGYILKAETTELTVSLGMRCRKMRTIMENTKIFDVFRYNSGKPRYQESVMLLQMCATDMHTSPYIQMLEFIY